MINIYNVRNNQIYNNNHVNFTSRSGSTIIGGKEYVHVTKFLRNYPTLDFTNTYLRKVFPQGTHITEFGCSSGEKPYSLMVLLSDANKDKRYKITGYDIAPNIVADAQRGVFEVKNSNVFSNHSEMNEYIFFNATGSHPTNIPKEQQDELRQKFAENFDFDPNKQTDTQTIKIKPGKAAGIIDFKVGDIEQIDTILPQGESGVVIFQNALYHILNPNDAIYRPKADTDRAERLFEKIHVVLPNNGIFVLGNLDSDHICKEKSICGLVYQNGERIKVFHSSPVHDALSRTGFEPIFYEQTNGLCDGNEVAYLPSVWRKVPKKSF